MKLKNNFVIKQIAGETVAIYCDDFVADFRYAVSLKGGAEVMFKALLEENTKENLVELLTRNFAISEQQAKTDIDVFLKLLRDNNLLDG